MTLEAVDKVIWAASFIGDLALLFVLVYRFRWRQLPVFSAMIFFQVAVNATLYFIQREASPHVFYLAYWITAFGDYFLQIALILEIARSVLRPTKDWVRDARAGFLLWSGVGVALATGVALSINSSASKGLGLWQVRITLFVSVLTLEMFLAMSVSANRLGLPWRSHVMALGQGISAIAIIAIFDDIGHIHYGWSRDFVVFDHIGQFVYLAALFYWSVSLWRPERQRSPLSQEMQEYLLALHRRVQYDLEGHKVEKFL